MDLTSRYSALRDFLMPWSALWGESVLRGFAEMERLIPGEWFRYGATAELADQYALGQDIPSPLAPQSLVNWVRQIRELCALPRLGDSRLIASPFDQDLTPKKKHEIEAVLGFFTSEGISPARILDIGGGAGHLARHLAHQLGCLVESIDRDPALQDKGRRIQRAYPWLQTLEDPVRFVPGEFPGACPVDAPPPGAWAVGLHTCGDLAWSVLELARSDYSVVGFGCCYERLDVAKGTQRSSFARTHPLPLTDESLFLANRGGAERPLDEFLFQQRVQVYRFSLHELLVGEGASPSAIASVGTASTQAYSGSFADYVRDRFRDHERHHARTSGQVPGLPDSLLRLSDSALQDLFRAVAPRVEKQRFAAFLRNLLARPLELSLLLDRAIWVTENLPAGEARVRLIEFFDPKLSPRNVAIVLENGG